MGLCEKNMKQTPVFFTEIAVKVVFNIFMNRTIARFLQLLQLVQPAETRQRKAFYTCGVAEME